MSRLKKTKQVFGEDVLSIQQQEKRFATPEIVANYRAERLACDTIVDLCCGAGFQTFAFAKTFKSVIAIERNPELVAQARIYAEKLGLKNIIFICGDILSQEIIDEIKKIAKRTPIDCIFCDPQRDAAEKERSLATIQPDIYKLLEVYGKITSNIAIELPPHISNTSLDAEHEYISLHGSLNRLTLYFGALKKAEKSIVLLPQNEKIIGFFQNFPKREISTFSSLTELSFSQRYSFLLEPNPALVLSGLFYEAFCAAMTKEKIQHFFINKDIVQMSYGKKTYFLSTENISNPFFTSYKIIEIVNENNAIEQKKNIKKLLQQHNAGKIVLRYSIASKEYWKEKSFFENGLKGTKTVHLFLFDNALICEKIVK